MDSPNALQIFKSAFERMDALMYILDQDGKLIDCNQHFLQLFGIEYIKDQSIYQLMQEQGTWTSHQIQNFQQSDVHARLSGKRKVEEQTLLQGSGVVFNFEISRTPLLDDAKNPVGLLVIMRDITQQKQLDEQLKALKGQLRFANNKMMGQTEGDASTASKTAKVLLIEDNPITQRIEKTILTNCRCVTDAVATPDEVDEIFQPGKYDLVLMDIGLEKGNGYQVTGVLRKRESGSVYRVPIIALTGYNPSEVGFECDDAEMDGILQKPLTPEQARQLVQRYIHHHTDVTVKGLKVFKH